MARKKDNTKKMSVDEALRRFFPAQMSGLGALKLFDIMEFSTATEERFVRLLGAMLVVVRLFTNEDGLSLQQAAAETAYRLGVSTATSKRYLQKNTVSIGPFFVQGRRVYLQEWLWEEVRVHVQQGVRGGVRGMDGVDAARFLLEALDKVLGNKEGESGDAYSSS